MFNFCCAGGTQPDNREMYGKTQIMTRRFGMRLHPGSGILKLTTLLGGVCVLNPATCSKYF